MVEEERCVHLNPNVGQVISLDDTLQLKDSIYHWYFLFPHKHIKLFNEIQLLILLNNCWTVKVVSTKVHLSLSVSLYDNVGLLAPSGALVFIMG